MIHRNWNTKKIIYFSHCLSSFLYCSLEGNNQRGSSGLDGQYGSKDEDKDQIGDSGIYF